MSHLHRFHIAPETPTAPTIALPREEAHHALRVARVRHGAEVELFDGRGRVLRGSLRPEGRREAFVEVTAESQTPRPTPQLTVAVAWLHRDKAVETIIRRATELGVGRVVFFGAEHSERKPKDSDKLQRVAVEAGKQCGCAWIPDLELAAELGEVLPGSAGDLLLADMHGEPAPLRTSLTGGDAMVLIGPEGDFTEEERAMALKAGARSLSLGGNTFRTEVAAGVAAALVLYEWGRLGPTA